MHVCSRGLSLNSLLRKRRPVTSSWSVDFSSVFSAGLQTYFPLTVTKHQGGSYLYPQQTDAVVYVWRGFYRGGEGGGASFRQRGKEEVHFLVNTVVLCLFVIGNDVAIYTKLVSFYAKSSRNMATRVCILPVCHDATEQRQTAGAVFLVLLKSKCLCCNKSAVVVRKISLRLLLQLRHLFVLVFL